MTLEQRVAVLEEVFSKIQDYYTSAYSGEEIDARLASAGVPIGITKEYKSVTEMNQDFTGTDVQRGQFVLILPDSTSSADYGKVYLKGTANWVYAFTLNTLTSIKGPIGPPGKKGDKGDPGEAGSSFAILGYFDTLDALKAAVPNPKAGDVYGVGTAPPYNIYIWDSVHGKWVGNGNLQGPQGEQGPEGKQGPDGKQGPEGPVGGSSNFVRYDAAQSLTDAQKAQARGNINAANGVSAFGKVEQGGWYRIASGSTYAGGILSLYNSYYSGGPTSLKFLVTMDTGIPEIICITSPASPYRYESPIENARLVKGIDDYHLYIDVFYKSVGKNDLSINFMNMGQMPASVQAPVFVAENDVLPEGETLIATMEFQNPPMAEGVEYRTTERYLGKPVYTKAVNFGAMPNNSAKAVSHGIANMDVCFMVYGHETANHRPIPTMCLSGNFDTPIGITVTDSKIVIHTTFDSNNDEAIVVMKYTKTTD